MTCSRNGTFFFTKSLFNFVVTVIQGAGDMSSGSAGFTAANKTIFNQNHLPSCLHQAIGYCLVKAGRKVVLVEDGFIGSGETGRTTAHITCALDDGYYEIEKTFGEEKSAIAAASHSAAIEWIQQTVEQEKIDCDFERVDGCLFLHPSDKLENLRKEYDATRRAGINTSWME